MKGKVKHYFPGGNTSKGFYSLYRYIMPQSKAKRIFCIKGGPGTGKSSFMKKIGKYYSEKGYDIEYQHCSSDNNSLDGIVIKGLNVVFLDGTSPHVVDPINPGAVDEILNMGEYWNEEGFHKYRNNVIEMNKEVGKTFKRAYKYIAAAKLVHDDWCSYYNDNLNYSKLNLMSEYLKEEILNKKIDLPGSERHMFATAFTPDGIVTFIENLSADLNTKYVLSGPPTIGKHIILEYLLQEGLKRGYYIEVLHSPLIPDRIEHLLFPEIGTAILTSNEINNKNFNGHEINLENMINTNLIKKYNPQIEESKNEFYSLLNKGLNSIFTAKAIHDKLETYYVPNMKFEEIDKLFENIIARISKYETDLKK